MKLDYLPNKTKEVAVVFYGDGKPRKYVTPLLCNLQMQPYCNRTLKRSSTVLKNV